MIQESWTFILTKYALCCLIFRNNPECNDLCVCNCVHAYDNMSAQCAHCTNMASRNDSAPSVSIWTIQIFILLICFACIINMYYLCGSSRFCVYMICLFSFYFYACHTAVVQFAAHNTKRHTPIYSNRRVRCQWYRKLSTSTGCVENRFVNKVTSCVDINGRNSVYGNRSACIQLIKWIEVL